MWVFPKNSGTPKWMVYNGKPYQNGWFGGTTIFGNIHFHPERSWQQMETPNWVGMTLTEGSEGMKNWEGNPFVNVYDSTVVSW